MQKKYFTIEEANLLLPAVSKDLEAVQAIKQQFTDKYEWLQQLKAEQIGNPDEDHFFSLECEIEFLQIEAKGHILNIHNQGAQLKDIEIGTIDFPAVINGVEVLLCWKQGEQEITHYHGLYDGFVGRKRIE